MAVLVVTVLLIGGFWLWARGETLKRRKQMGKRYPKAAASTATPRAMSVAVRKISTYTHDHDVAARLLHSTRQANMSKSLDWCAEKVIDDIVRDRR